MTRSRLMRTCSVAAMLSCASAFAATYQHGAMVREAVIYVSPDPTSAKLGELGRGREVIILESPRDWVHVEANVTPERTITGWILYKGVIGSETPEGDKILFGEATDSEDEASRSRGRRGAAQDAMWLYRSIYEIFPKSPLAGEALYRAADIRWQLDKVDVMTKPSAREQDAYLRGEIDDSWMKESIKKFPGTKWADLAAYALLDNKICGDWQGSSKCPEKEADMYEKYAAEHPQSPKAAQALYNAAWRQSALIEIYKTEEDRKKSDQAKARAIGLAQKVIAQSAQGDWNARGQRLLYLVQNNIPTWGNSQE
jgi:hypothetical protein